MNQRVGGNGDDADGWYYLPVSKSTFSHVADTIVFGDGTQCPEYGNNSGALYWWTPGLINGAWGTYATTDAQWAALDTDLGGNPARFNVRYRHTLSANLSFGDGHSKSMKRGSVRIWNWQIGGDSEDINIR